MAIPYFAMMYRFGWLPSGWIRCPYKEHINKSGYDVETILAFRSVIDTLRKMDLLDDT